MYPLKCHLFEMDWATTVTFYPTFFCGKIRLTNLISQLQLGQLLSILKWKLTQTPLYFDDHRYRYKVKFDIDLRLFRLCVTKA